jgi:thioredoxin-related protein
MDLTITPDTYIPSVNEQGNYIDNIPSIKNGILCPCGSRKDKIYENVAKFTAHIKSKSHQKWLMLMNQNKANYYIEMLKNKELVENQQRIIANLENQLKIKTLTIDYLTEQLTNKKTQQICEINLLDL